MENKKPDRVNFIELFFWIFVYIYSLYKIGFLILTFLSAYFIGIAIFSLSGNHFPFYSRFIVLLLPPVSMKYESLFGFELRILLTNLSGKILQQLDTKTLVEGNQIFWRENWYSVDPECEGIKMLTGFILLILIFYHRVCLGKLKFIVYVVLFILLWLLSNIFRIILLTYFSIPSDNISHSLIGIFLFFSFLIFPYLIIELFSIEKKRANSKLFRPKLFYSFLLLLLIFISSFIPEESLHNQYVFPETWNGFKKESLDGIFRKELIESKIASYKKGDIRIIVKKEQDPIRFSHSTIYCWKGSGFDFKKEKIVRVGNIEFKSALIEKNYKKYNLYWWYESDKGTKTSSEFFWRYRSLFKGEKFTLYNLILPIGENYYENFL